MTWLPAGFIHPERVNLPSGHHLRPIRESDVAIDYPAVMSVRDRLWARYGPVWGWPTPTLSYTDDKEDLAHHETEIAASETFNYAILDEAESELLGCIYIDPPTASSPQGTDAMASWWVVDRAVGGDLERVLGDFVPHWLRDAFGFQAIHYFP